MPSREIMNLGPGMSFVKRQNDATDVADELLQLCQMNSFRPVVGAVISSCLCRERLSTELFFD